MRSIGVVALLFVAGCVVDFSRPSKNAAITCANDRDCPAGFRCAEQIGACRPGTVEDLEGPTLQEVVAKNETTLMLTFNEELAPAPVTALGNYGITPPLALLGATLLEDGQRVALTVADGEQQAGLEYTLVVTGVADVDGNAIQLAHNLQTFIGYGTVPDRSPPDLLSPTQDEVARAGAVTLVWSGRIGATSYTVEVFRLGPDGVEEIPVLAPPAVVSAPTTAYTLTLSEPRTHVWRVRADTTDGAPATASFEVVDDRLRVVCPPGQASSCAAPPDRVESGNLDTPFTSVQRAIDAAQGLGVGQILVASYQGVEALEYREEVAISEGVNLAGGYDPTFAEANRRLDLPSHIVSRGGPALLTGAPDQPTVIEAISFTSDPVSAASSIGLWLIDTNSNVTVRGCQIRAQGVGGLKVGVRISGSRNDVPLLEDCTVTVDGGQDSLVVDIDGGGARLVGNLLEALDCRVTTGIRADDIDTLILEENEVQIRSQAGITNQATGVTLSDRSDGVERVHLRDNRIVVGPGNNNSYGVVLGHFIAAEVRGNQIITSGPSGFNAALILDTVSAGRVYVGPDDPPSIAITNNLLWVGDGGSQAGQYALGILMRTFDGHSVYAGTVVSHNTILVGTTTGQAHSAGIRIQGLAPSITNNLILMRGAPATSYAVLEENDEGDPRSLQHNVYGGALTAPYRNEGTTDVADVDGLDGELLKFNAEASRYDGNQGTTAALDELLVNPDPSDLTTADWSLAPPGGGEWILTWGKSTALADCGTVQRPATCGGVWLSSGASWSWQHGVTDDLHHAPRIDPVTVGAVETDL